jgi:carbon-monoxide dehydrogenase small subunit
MLSCIIPLGKIIDSKISTLEHFMKSDDYEDIEKAFKELDINFCGFCNSGKIFTTYQIIKNIPLVKKNEFKEQVIENISFFTCNCVEQDSLTAGIFLAAKIRKERLGAKKHGK